MQISGIQNIAKCFEIWDDIIRQNAEANGTFKYKQFLEYSKQYNTIVNKYIEVKTMIIKRLHMAYDPKNETDVADIRFLRKSGYGISTKNNQEFKSTLESSLRSVMNLVTKAVMKRNELEKLNDHGQEKGEVVTYYSLVAKVAVTLGFNLHAPTLLLAEYNAYKKEAIEKERAMKEAMSKKTTVKRR